MIDRHSPVSFCWAGQRLQGYAGDTLASALLANGVSTVGRSFKYHRRRGLLAAGLEEPNAIVQLESGPSTIPNLKATQIELYEGLVASPVNAWPSADVDVLAIIGAFKRFIPAAFYYKTFMWPGWRFFEPSIRRAAGLGVAPTLRDPDVYEHRFANVETLIVGSGAAGLASAAAAAAAGQQVLLVENDSEFGGGLLDSHELVEGRTAGDWLNVALSSLRGLNPQVRLMPRTMAFGFYDHGLVGLCERRTDHQPLGSRIGPRQVLWKVRCDRVILATGAIERPIAFANNDRPGVMLASAAQTYVTRYGAAPGRCVVVATNNDSAYAAAFALHDRGVKVAAIVESRPAPSAGCAAAADARSIAVVSSSVPIRALGGRCVAGVQISSLDRSSEHLSFKCDCILMSDGWNPAVHLHSQSGGAIGFDEALQAFLPDAPAQATKSVGAAAGVFDLDEAIRSARGNVRGIPHARSHAAKLGPTRRFADGDPHAHYAWLDFQNDVTVGDLQLAARENFRSVEHLKRYTTLGMASDQGKTSNVAAIQALGSLLHRSPEKVGTTKFRPPYDPVSIGAFAGRAVGQDLMPLAETAALHDQIKIGAVVEPYGAWKRSAYFPRNGEDEHAAIDREVLQTRNSAGLFDASPLGKIEVKGPDAAEFLERIYVGNVKSLKVGRCRYGLMLDEHGIVFDDGVFARVSEEHFLVGTTSGHAVTVADNLQEWLQCEWPSLRVLTENVTTAWAVMNVAGPRARAILAAVGTDVDLSAQAFPQMAYREGHVGGALARIQRVSFTGELSFEVSVPWSYGRGLWHALMNAGHEDGITPFGVESLMVMRTEKGFLHVGSDTDGTTYPQDVGFAPALSKKVGDFVGRRSTMRVDGTRSDRRQFVGLEVIGGGGPLVVGSHVLAPDTGATKTEGWVTSSVFSPTLKRPVALGLVARGQSRIGEAVRVWDLGTIRNARIVDPRFFDQKGSRLDA